MSGAHDSTRGRASLLLSREPRVDRVIRVAVSTFTLITGVSRGIGQGVARTLAARGPLVLTARSADAARALAKELGPSHLAFGLDVASAEQRIALAEALTRQQVRLSCVVHNAAIYERSSTREAAAKTIATNVFGPLRLTEALLPVLTEEARLVLVSSSLGLLHGYAPEMVRRLEATRTVAEVEQLASEYLAATATGTSASASADAAERAGFSRDPYGVSKALLNALARALAATWPRRTVVAASPGWVQTDMGGREAPLPLSAGVARIVEATTAKVRSGAFYADSDAFER